MNRRQALKLTIAATLSPYLASCRAIAPVISQVDVARFRERSGGESLYTYLELTAGNGLKGYGGPLISAQAQSLEKILPQLRKILVGRDPLSADIGFEWIWDRIFPGKQLSDFQNGIDPLSGKAIWNTRRSERHTETGKIIAGLSEVDNALWDVRGKLADKPVYQLLGGKREQLPAYMSLTPGEDLVRTIKQAKELYDQGQTAQKWFFLYGPPDGKEGFSKIVGLVEGLRAELGEEAMLMFDFSVGHRGRCDWDVDYAIRVAKAIQPFNPTWLEEPFSPEEIEAYRRLKGETGITLATGEHTYTRWNILPFLEEELVSFVQSDPEWCGGISEHLKICELVSGFGNIKVIPHGHQVLAASQVVASQAESLCPMVEFGPAWVLKHQGAQTRIIAPQAGFINTPDEPGIGPSVDTERFEKVSG